MVLRSRARVRLDDLAVEVPARVPEHRHDDDEADEEGEETDDRQGVETDILHDRHHRAPADAARIQDQAAERRHRLADEGQQAEEFMPGVDGATWDVDMCQVAASQRSFGRGRQPRDPPPGRGYTEGRS